MATFEGTAKKAGQKLTGGQIKVFLLSKSTFMYKSDCKTIQYLTDYEANLVQDENHVTVRLIPVGEVRHRCMEKLVTLQIPLWRNSQSKSFQVFLGERRRGRQHGLKHKSQVLEVVVLSLPFSQLPFLDQDRCGCYKKQNKPSTSPH